MSFHLKLSVGLVACAVGFVALSLEEESSNIPTDIISHIVSVTNKVTTRYQAWICSIIATILVGLSGVFPLIVVPTEGGSTTHHGVSSSTLRLLLSFAVGSLLGDVFLHLLPEAWHLVDKTPNASHLSIGLWVLAGIFSFIILEVIFSKEDEEHSKEGAAYSTSEADDVSVGAASNNNYKELSSVSHRRSHHANGSKNNNGHAMESGGGSLSNHRNSNGHHASNGHVSNGYVASNGTAAKSFGVGKSSATFSSSQREKAPATKHITGYLNLLANCIDNFTHGLSVAGSFLVSFKVGVLTTFAILIHEIPHEIGDFAILLKSGFSRWEAAKAQVITAGVGLLGATAALSCDSVDTFGTPTMWILPFTAGGFLNIALVNVLPDLMKEKDKRESAKQLLCMGLGVASMGIVTVYYE